MVSRMDRYKEDDSGLSRFEKNKELYDNLGNNTKYTNIEEVTNSNTFEIDINNTKVNSRSEYQKIKEYQKIDAIPKVKKELDNFNFLYNTKEKKVYDINRVIEEARNNRVDKDDEEKRKLKDNSYNILLNLDEKSLEEYRKKRNERVLSPEEEDIHEFIDTITTKTLAGELDKETSVSLLSDLMATNILDRVDTDQEEDDSDENNDNDDSDDLDDSSTIEGDTLAEIISNGEITRELENSDLNETDNEFYTNNLKIMDDDLEMDNSLEEKHMPVLLKILLIFLIILAIGIGVYFIYKNFL